jgi:hypothetical protein
MTQITLTDGITLLNGAVFNHLHPEECKLITIADLAQPLSNICRFAGQLPYFYSVAQHAVNASRIAEPGFEFDALMHDTAEAFTNDIVTPLKVAVPLFKEIELKIEADMARRFEFRYPLPEEVKTVDMQMLALEMTVIRGQNARDWKHLDGVEFEHLRGAVDLTSWSPNRAKFEFMDAYNRLRP